MNIDPLQKIVEDPKEDIPSPMYSPNKTPPNEVIKERAPSF